MLLAVKLLVLLWSINFAPPLLAFLCDEKWNRPIDGGRRMWDGRPVFGDHKTMRGVLGGVLAGGLAGFGLGFPLWLGFAAGLLSMSGDLVSSFIKRRVDLPCGKVVPGLDQVFEGALPLLVLGPYFSLGAWLTVLLLFIFGCGAFAGSLALNEVVLRKPIDNYPRPLRPGVRLREIRACQILSNPLHHFVNFEDSIYYHVFMKTVFKCLGVYEKGRKNALKLREEHVTLEFPDLPGAFDGYRILFLTDLHLDGLEGLTERLLEIVKPIRADLCIIGGDLRMETHGSFAPALAQLRRLLPEIRAKDGIYGILGNHDCLEIIEPLSEHGIQFLVNDSAVLTRDGERIHLAGVDDPHYFKCHDLDQAFEKVPPREFAILASHSNEIYRQAAAYGPRLYLCGHTHGGQIRLPVVGALFTHSKAPRRLLHGRWSYDGMEGYTSGGVGVSGVPVRFATEGEVSVITLKRKTREVCPYPP